MFQFDETGCQPCQKVLIEFFLGLPISVDLFGRVDMAVRVDNHLSTVPKMTLLFSFCFLNFGFSVNFLESEIACTIAGITDEQTRRIVLLALPIGYFVVFLCIMILSIWKCGASEDAQDVSDGPQSSRDILLVSFATHETKVNNKFLSQPFFVKLPLPKLSSISDNCKYMHTYVNNNA